MTPLSILGVTLDPTTGALRVRLHPELEPAQRTAARRRLNQFGFVRRAKLTGDRLWATLRKGGSFSPEEVRRILGDVSVALEEVIHTPPPEALLNGPSAPPRSTPPRHERSYRNWPQRPCH